MIAELIGRVLSQPKVHNRLIAIALHNIDNLDTPIMSPDGTEVYMHRGWLFNKIGPDYKRKYRFIPFSIRIHHILRHDLDRHLHDHPFNARTWIMRGGYEEVRLRESTLVEPNWNDQLIEIQRVAGDTSRLGFQQYHKITKVAEGGALTLFAFGPYKGDWGFRVDGRKIPRAEYERRYQSAPQDLLAQHVADGKHIPRPMQNWNINRDGQYPNCVARQDSDMTYCEVCGIAWDTNDPERPPCQSSVLVRVLKAVSED